MKRMWKHAAWLLVLAAAGCAAPQHLGETFGLSFRSALVRQSVRPPDVPVAEPVMGLDTQEAAVIWEGYIRSLAPDDRDALEQEPIFYIAPPPAAPVGRPLMPSPGARAP